MNIRTISRSAAAAAIFAVSLSSGVAVSEEYEKHSSGAVAAFDDATITAKIKAKYMEDASLKGADINVTTVNGVVTLKGTAPNGEVTGAAENIARHMDGVTRVDNKIYAPSAAKNMEEKTRSVAKNTQRAVSDSWITTKVKSVLLADSLTKGLEINVKTYHHVVSLKGSVDSQAAVDQAVHLANGIEGVESVDSSELHVGGK